MATGPFEFNPETREFTRRGSVRSWPVDEGTAADMPAVSTIEEELSESDDMPVGVLVNPAPIRRRRRSYAASETPPAQKTKLWRVAMWGLILFLLIGWLVMIAVLTNRSGAGADSGRQFKFDRGDAVEPDSMLPE